jgi:hypothetical protein
VQQKLSGSGGWYQREIRVDSSLESIPSHSEDHVSVFKLTDRSMASSMNIEQATLEIVNARRD